MFINVMHSDDAGRVGSLELAMCCIASYHPLLGA